MTNFKKIVKNDFKHVDFTSKSLYLETITLKMPSLKRPFPKRVTSREIPPKISTPDDLILKKVETKFHWLP
jgi:hypothetical protein